MKYIKEVQDRQNQNLCCYYEKEFEFTCNNKLTPFNFKNKNTNNIEIKPYLCDDCYKNITNHVDDLKQMIADWYNTKGLLNPENNNWNKSVLMNNLIIKSNEYQIKPNEKWKLFWKKAKSFKELNLPGRWFSDFKLLRAFYMPNTDDFDFFTFYPDYMFKDMILNKRIGLDIINFDELLSLGSSFEEELMGKPKNKFDKIINDFSMCSIVSNTKAKRYPVDDVYFMIYIDSKLLKPYE